MLHERDWILRVTREIAQFIARALGLVDERQREKAVEVLESGCASALGIEFRTLAFLDAASAVALLGEPPRALGFARLLEAMGEVEHRSGDPLRAEVRWRHALEVVSAVLERRPGLAAAEELAGSLRERLTPR